ncbi:MAG: hypothetical protein N4A68_17670 [Maledivibacter sp.]|jgi:hypothetical protein|nr:hypothetical protein [Maledivibacter sp.]
MVTTEKVFDMLPYGVSVFEKLKIEDFFKNKKSKQRGKNLKQEDGLDFIKYLLKNLSKVKEEVFNIVAIYDDKKVEEIRSQEVAKTIEALRALFKEEGIMDFFNQAM